MEPLNIEEETRTLEGKLHVFYWEIRGWRYLIQREVDQLRDPYDEVQSTTDAEWIAQGMDDFAYLEEYEDSEEGFHTEEAPILEMREDEGDIDQLFSN